MSPRTRDLWVGLGTAALFAYVLLVVIPEQIRTPEGISMVMSPAFWPSVVAALAIVLGLALAVKGFFSAGGEAADEGEAGPMTWRTAAAIALLIAYYWLLKPLGIVLGSIVALLTLGVLFGERRFVVLTALAVVLPSVLYLFFTDVASIPMPLGPLSALF